MYVHACCVPFCFPGARKSRHLQVACMHLKCWTIHVLHLSVIPIHSSLRTSVACGTDRSALYIYFEVYDYIHIYSAAFQVAGSWCTRDLHNNHRQVKHQPHHHHQLSTSTSRRLSLVVVVVVSASVCGGGGGGHLLYTLLLLCDAVTGK